MWTFLKSLFFAPAASPETVQRLTTEIESITTQSKIVVASKSHCPYCTRTKQTLASYGIQLEPLTDFETPVSPQGKSILLELNQLSDGSLIQDILQRISGQRTVPNIYINGKHIGGNSDLQALHTSGQLELLLKSAGLI
ncbi:glutaredoxin [Nadsonia fulvescens var. elongata DSM 6958]|uniref:Glutaredoxin n=1 Tax=Nadsonia fulvescens var. elongata DSM 6958 TaxID=857566 RepID=A0A1E3PPX6_9ASCO|nr:glutaredoxin [Nadsonia fulvescens var. elongata DSM 6958]